jgi:hypothetical protein
MELKPIRSLGEHLEMNGGGQDEPEQFGFEEMLRRPSTLREGEAALPPTIPDIAAFEDE